jgi:hypothetical protein
MDLEAPPAEASLAGLVRELTQPAADAQNQQLTSWLVARHLHSGLSGYWESNVVTLTSGDRVQIRAVAPSEARLTPASVNRKRSGTTQARTRRTSSCSSPGWRDIPA